MLFKKVARVYSTLQRHNTKNSKQIFPEKELCGLSPKVHIHVSVSDLYISTIGLLQENMWTDPENISTAQRHMHVEIGTEDGVFVALYLQCKTHLARIAFALVQKYKLYYPVVVH